MKKMNSINIFSWVAGLAFLVSACSAPILSLQGGQAADSQQVGYAVAWVNEPTVEDEENGENATVQYEGVRFTVDTAVATGANGQVVSENRGSSEGPYWEIHPQYLDLSLAGYPQVQSVYTPTISVYPVEEYRKLTGQANKTLDNLKDLLVQKPADERQIPFLPVRNAGQVFHSNLQYLDFQNGSGVRYLAIYAQYLAPVNNQDLFYTFQGLTRDGRYFVSIVLPVNHSSLPADLNALSISEMDAITKDYDNYRAGWAARLSSQPGSSFIPDLLKLDALVASLAVEK